MCYKIEVQNKNAEKLNRKLDELNLPIYMRKYFIIKIESKAGALNYLGVIVDLLNWFIEDKMINKESISDIEPSDFTDIMAEDITLYLKDENLFEERLKRDGKVEPAYAKFSAQSSVNQQRVYLQMSEEIKQKYPNIHVYNIENSKPLENVQNELKEILKF